jgi:hypothetical protein
MADLASWLAAHPRVCDAITWETSAGPQRYLSWSVERKSELQVAFDAFAGGGAVGFDDPVPNALAHADGDLPTTAFAPADAWKQTEGTVTLNRLFG